MKTYRHDQPAEYGLYLCAWPPDLRFVGAQGESIGGLAGATYRRVPTPLALLIAPLLGGAFVLAFPLLVIVAVAAGLAKLAWTAVRATVVDHAWLAAPRWQPAAAWLSKSPRPDAHAPQPGDLDDLRRQVQARRAADSQGEDTAHKTSP